MLLLTSNLLPRKHQYLSTFKVTLSSPCFWSESVSKVATSCGVSLIQYFVGFNPNHHVFDKSHGPPQASVSVPIMQAYCCTLTICFGGTVPLSDGPFVVSLYVVKDPQSSLCLRCEGKGLRTPICSFSNAKPILNLPRGNKETWGQNEIFIFFFQVFI